MSDESKTETNGTPSATVTINRIVKLLEEHSPRATQRIMSFVQDTIDENMDATLPVHMVDTRQATIPFGES